MHMSKNCKCLFIRFDLTINQSSSPSRFLRAASFCFSNSSYSAFSLACSSSILTWLFSVIGSPNSSLFIDFFRYVFIRPLLVYYKTDDPPSCSLEFFYSRNILAWSIAGSFWYVSDPIMTKVCGSRSNYSLSALVPSDSELSYPWWSIETTFVSLFFFSIEAAAWFEVSLWRCLFEMREGEDWLILS